MTWETDDADAGSHIAERPVDECCSESWAPRYVVNISKSWGSVRNCQIAGVSRSCFTHMSVFVSPVVSVDGSHPGAPFLRLA